MCGVVYIRMSVCVCVSRYDSRTRIAVITATRGLGIHLYIHTNIHSTHIRTHIPHSLRKRCIALLSVPPTQCYEIWSQCTSEFFKYSCQQDGVAALCVRVFVCMHVYAPLFVCVPACAFVCMYVCSCVRMFVEVLLWNSEVIQQQVLLAPKFWVCLSARWWSRSLHINVQRERGGERDNCTSDSLQCPLKLPRVWLSARRYSRS